MNLTDPRSAGRVKIFEIHIEITLSSSIVYDYVMKEIVEESRREKNYFLRYSREVQDISQRS